MTNDEDGGPSAENDARSLNAELRKNEQAAMDPAADAESPADKAKMTEELLELARDFLKDESIRNESREKKVEFLEGKGLSKDAIDKLLAESSGDPSNELGLKTIHDSAGTSTRSTREDAVTNTRPPQPQPQSRTSLARDSPPIITYPEFLLKPQKPAPLVTFRRLAYAAYAVAGLSALTYGANKYLVQPMIDSLTESRHELSSLAIEDLEKLNTKLESTVSHIPYTASAAALKAQHEHHHGEHDDHESDVSDPTELFHRDIATQTTPNLSRTSSTTSLNKDTLDMTQKQATRLSALATTLESLNSIISPHPTAAAYLPPDPQKKMQTALTELQGVLDRLEATYNPYRSDYTSLYGSMSNGTTAKGREKNEAAKFRAEIRALKGAFLSSRNFPSPRPVSATGR